MLMRPSTTVLLAYYALAVAFAPVLIPIITEALR